MFTWSDNMTITLGLASLLTTVFLGGIAFFRQSQKEFMTRPECVLKHEKDTDMLEDVGKQLAYRAQRTHDLANEMQRLILELNGVKIRLERGDERQRWIVAALGSLMSKVGANGIPPPPEH